MEKFKTLIDAIKTSNKLAADQIEKNKRSIKLLEELIAEHEQSKPGKIIGTPFDEPLPPLKSEFIQPHEMKAREWYVIEAYRHNGQTIKFLSKFHKIDDGRIFDDGTIDLDNFTKYDYGFLCRINEIKSIRQATQAEIIYVSDELECPTHGGNDLGHINNLNKSNQ